MRRHANWSLKVILGIVSLTFIAYFGFNQIQGNQSKESEAFKVGKESIPYAWYHFFYQDAHQKLQEQFKDSEIPESYQNFLQNDASQKVVFRNLVKQFAGSIGLQVTDLELAQKITEDKGFDPVAYKSFLKDFYYRNTFSYEDLVREDLLIQKFQQWAQRTETLPSEDAEVGQWTFETQRKKEIQKVGPITLKERGELFGGMLDLEDYVKIFNLNTKGAVLNPPLKKGDEILSVRLIEFKKIPKEKKSGSEDAPRLPQLVDMWFRQFSKNIPVKSNLKKDF